jgi:NAD(P)-dependent dehydrogenase (short-subunit alcohol dehydrogenase family)
MNRLEGNRPFTGKVAIVTGGTSGIGEATALEFADAGAAVVLCGRRQIRGGNVVRCIQERGGSAVFIPVDICDERGVAGLVETTLRTFGRLDFALNNAGISGSCARLCEQTDEQWDTVFERNVKSVWRCMRHQIPAMIRSGGGAVVNNASVFGLVGVGVGVAPYVASKHAVVGLSKAAALEYAMQNIRINVVCPGFTHTEMLSSSTATRDTIAALIDDNVPLKRMASVQEIARVARWLCSDDASFVTGQAIAVDGGWTAR